MAKVLKGDDIGLTEYTALTKAGEMVPVLLHSSAIIRDGRVLGLRGFMINICERKRVELALRESEERNRRILETVPDWIAIAMPTPRSQRSAVSALRRSSAETSAR